MCAVALAVTPLAVQARDVGVVVNGTTLVFDQPPLERAGRIFVPLRGLFERLGASVVFDAGRIAMTAGTRTIGLHVGEATATIDGHVETLDDPPIVVGGRTLVPLRFVAQALGARVAYDGAARIVSVDAAALAAPPGAAVAAPEPTPVAAVAPGDAGTTVAPPSPIIAVPPGTLAKGEIPIELRLLRVEPPPNSALARKHPEISATFGENVDASTVRIAIDGRDATSETLATPRSFVTDPNAELPAGSHTVVVSGRTPDKERFEERWTFATTAAPNGNYVSGLEPVSGAVLGGTTFDVSGYTRPKARVRVIGTTSTTSAAFSDVSDGSSTIDVVASARGYFEAPLVLADHGTGLVDVRVASTAPDGSVAVRTLRLRL
ncbi:MAG: hypothetical protein NVSMB19_03440 [Vulcanimicrobiaceae bacterium]